MSYDVPQTVRMETVTTSNKDFERAILCIILVLSKLQKIEQVQYNFTWCNFYLNSINHKF